MGWKGVQVQDIERGIVLVIGDVDPNILVKKLKNIKKNAVIRGSWYNIMAHNEESSRSNLPGNRSTTKKHRRGGGDFFYVGFHSLEKRVIEVTMRMILISIIIPVVTVMEMEIQALRH